MFPSLSHIDCLLSSTLYFFMESSFHERAFSDTFVLLRVSWDSLEQWWPETSPSTSGLLAFYFHFWTRMRDFAHSPSEFSYGIFLTPPLSSYGRWCVGSVDCVGSLDTSVRVVYFVFSRFLCLST